jgi:hypothetical protein
MAKKKSAPNTAKKKGGLTSDQKAKFEAALQAVGLDPAEVSKVSLNTKDIGKTASISSNVKKSALTPHYRIVNSIAELMKYGGVPDEHFKKAKLSDAHVSYPEAKWDEKRNRLISKATDGNQLAFMLTPDERDTLKQAMTAYMLGDSSKVKSYEEMINAVHFPMTATVFAAQNITIAANTTLTINPPGDWSPSDPYQLIIGILTIETGGQLQIMVPCNLEVQQIIQL